MKLSEYTRQWLFVKKRSELKPGSFDALVGTFQRYVENGIGEKELKEVTDEGLLEHNYAPIETPVEVASPVVLEAIKPVEEELELPQLAQPEEIELPALNGEQPKEELNPDDFEDEV